MQTTWLIGRRCKRSNVFSLPVLIARGLDLQLCRQPCFFLPFLFSFEGVMPQQLVFLTVRVHPFPFRTRKLSSPVPTILVWRRTGKIGQCQHKGFAQANPLLNASLAQRQSIRLLTGGLQVRILQEAPEILPSPTVAAFFEYGPLAQLVRATGS